MAAPIRISTEDNIDSGAFTGPFSSNGALYQVGGSAVGSIKIYKSTDSGATWVVQNDVNSPNVSYSSFDLGFDTAFVGTDMIFAFRSTTASSRVSIKTFSTLTDTWGALSSAGPDVNSGNPTKLDPPLRMVRIPSGDIYVFYTEWLTVNQTIQYTIYTGSWSAGVELVGATGTIFNYIQTAFQAASGVLQITYRKCPDDSTLAGTLHHISLTTGGVIGSPTTIDPVAREFPTGKSFELSGAIQVPYYNADALTGVWTGTPTASPTWSFTLLNDLTWPAEVHDIGDQAPAAGSPDYGARAFGFVDSGTAYILWQSTNGDAFTYTVNRIYYVSNSGSGWSAPTLIYDEATDPGGWYSADTGKLFAISASLIGDFLYFSASIDCGGQALPTPFETVAPISIICDSPPGGQVGVPYSHTFPASGGTEPYTFSISSGSLPDGLTLNTVTGVVSGIPTTAGPFNFTVTVTGS